MERECDTRQARERGHASLWGAAAPWLTCADGRVAGWQRAGARWAPLLCGTPSATFPPSSNQKGVWLKDTDRDAELSAPERGNLAGLWPAPSASRHTAPQLPARTPLRPASCVPARQNLCVSTGPSVPQRPSPRTPQGHRTSLTFNPNQTEPPSVCTRQLTGRLVSPSSH